MGDSGDGICEWWGAGPVDVAYFYWSGPAADDGLDCPIIDFFLFCFAVSVSNWSVFWTIHTFTRRWWGKKRKKKNSV